MDRHKLPHIPLNEREEICKRIMYRIERVEPDTDRKRSRMKGFFKSIGKLTIIVLAAAGIGFLGVYAAVNMHLTNTDGIVDKQADDFWQSGQEASAVLGTPTAETVMATIATGTDPFFNVYNYCRMESLKAEYPGTFWRVLDLANHDQKTLAENDLNSAMDSLNLNANDNSSCDKSSDQNVSSKDFATLAGAVDAKDLFIFSTSTEWAFFKNAVLKDVAVINRVEKDTGVKGRILVAELASEQMRLFYSDRGWFEKMISPAKVLTSMTQFSWGVLGIKEDTAAAIENNLKATSSPFYIGPEYENILDFSGGDISQERFQRITNHQDHYYAYLYAALFNKEIIAQWQKSGFDISDRPEILATIYNIGFAHSKPKSDPQMGGAALDIDGNQISFGRVAYDFYYSGELLDQFPQ